MFLTGKAHIELRKVQRGSVQCCVTSPPYWPARRLYNMLADGTIPPPTPDDIGFEPTWKGYCDHTVRRDLRELQRVLRPDGVVFVVLDDVIANPASIYGEQHYERSKVRLPSQVSLRTQDTTYLRKQGNWLGLPYRFAEAMIDDGWFWRDLIIWDKGSSGRKESADSRCRHNFEYILMFTLSASGYWYDQDPLRIPLTGGPTGFPEELARRCLLLGAPPCEMLLRATVIDFYGGSGPVSAVAKRLGLKSIHIDSNPVYAAEAQQRVLAAERDPGDPGVANDNLRAGMRAGD
jgi:site-specific DNA-methyltransferase (cytosine-N4-specific)